MAHDDTIAQEAVLAVEHNILLTYKSTTALPTEHIIIIPSLIYLFLRKYFCMSHK